MQNSNLEYSEARGYNLGLARELGITEACVYNQLLFWQARSGAGNWFYKKYEEMAEELPFSERTLRNAYGRLEEAGYIETIRRKANGVPTMHFRISRSVGMHPANLAGSMDSANLAGSINNKTPIKNLPKQKRRIEEQKSDDATKVKEIYLLYLTCFKLGEDKSKTAMSKAQTRYKLTPKRREAIKRRLADAGENMLKAAILGYSRQVNFEGRRHWAGDNDTGWVASLDEFICRSYEQVEKGANFYEAQKTDKSNDPWAAL